MIFAVGNRICKRPILLSGMTGFCLLVGCAIPSRQSQDPSVAAAKNPAQVESNASAGAPPRRFPPPTETDLLLDAKPHALPDIKSAAAEAATLEPGKDKPSRGPWRIQVGALADLESAQARKRELDAKLGGSVELSFDAPYYKLRWGGFATKQEAEDKLLEMSEVIREGFVIRQ
jgi:cell division protein FtsN